ncbi:MAG: DUF1289 domain-containing protein [Gammaproteobacteria bacterium]|nr:DUF1289 domain-containing protein [Gammaproteobacteria bacterium]
MYSIDNCLSQDREEKPLSPCVLICTLDGEARCLGCGRTLEQVSRWSVMSAAEQWAVIDELAARKKQE